MFEEVSLAMNFVETGIGFGDLFTGFEDSRIALSSAPMAQYQTRGETSTQRSYIAATLDISPFAA